MPGIIEATKDLDIAIVFNNAGYIVTGFFDQTSLDAQLANMVKTTTPILSFCSSITGMQRHGLRQDHSPLPPTDARQEIKGSQPTWCL
jgi:hypothetical protein